MAPLNWLQYTERLVGKGHPSLADTTNRALRQLLSESGYDPDATTFPGLMGPVFNVKAFGAVGDGVTDDAVAIQEAVNTASAAGGGRVWFPFATYAVSLETVVPEGVTLEGESFGQWYSVVYRTADVPIFSMIGTSGTHLRGFRLRHLKLSSSSLLFTSDAIKLRFVDFARITHSRIDQMGGRALYCEEVWDSIVQDVNFDHCGSATGTPVLELNSGTSTSNCNSIHIVGCDFESCKGPNIKSLRGGGGTGTNNKIRIHRCKFESVDLTHEFINLANTSVAWITETDFAANNVSGGAASPITTAAVLLSSCNSIYIHAYWETIGPATFQNWQYFVQATSSTFVEIAGWMSEASNNALTGATFINGVTSMNNCIVNRCAQIVNPTNKPLLGGTFRRARWLGTGNIGSAYSASITDDAANGDISKITATDGVAFTINAPSNVVKGQFITYDIVNSSGGAMGAITWNALFKLGGAFTNPANGKRRTITYYHDGGNLVEVSRAAADI